MGHQRVPSRTRVDGVLARTAVDQAGVLEVGAQVEQRQPGIAGDGAYPLVVALEAPAFIGGGSQVRHQHRQDREFGRECRQAPQAAFYPAPSLLRVPGVDVGACVRTLRLDSPGHESQQAGGEVQGAVA